MSDYWCANCGERSSMMGHYRNEEIGFTCQPKTNGGKGSPPMTDTTASQSPPEQAAQNGAVRERDLAILEKHGTLSDALAAELPDDARTAWYHLTSMYSHRGDGIPTQFTYPQEVRDAAKALVQAALAATPPAPVEGVDLRTDGESAIVSGLE